jgi:uncharacterized BrkB/YihY/UPF0761 family membrane protein
MLRRDDIEARYAQLRERWRLFDDVAAAYDRDRDAFAGVLGAAIALRLFLFGVGAHVVMAAVTTMVARDSTFNADLQDTILVGETAKGVASESGWGLFGILVSALVFTALCGRSLATTMGTASASAWRLERRRAKVSVLTSGLITATVFGSFALGVVMSMLRDVGGWVPPTSAWVGIGTLVFFAWVVVLRLLPRGTDDPVQLMPGAAFFAVGYTALSAFLRVYVPNSIARRDDFLGGTATIVVLLGSFFFIGRLVSTSFVVTAVISERYGSLLRKGPN